MKETHRLIWHDESVPENVTTMWAGLGSTRPNTLNIVVYQADCIKMLREFTRAGSHCRSGLLVGLWGIEIKFDIINVFGFFQNTTRPHHYFDTNPSALTNEAMQARHKEHDYDGETEVWMKMTQRARFAFY